MGWVCSMNVIKIDTNTSQTSEGKKIPLVRPRNVKDDNI
jgi:hypothetical protein